MAADRLSPLDTLDFLRGVRVDHIDGVMAEMLIEEHFSPPGPAPLELVPAHNRAF